MSFFEPVLISLISAGVGAFAVYFNGTKAARTLLKFGPVVRRAYDIIDPVLDQNLHNWKGSQVDKAFELAIEIASDGKLSAPEIKRLSFYMAKAWLPQKAADKVRYLESLSKRPTELVVAEQLAAKISKAV